MNDEKMYKMIAGGFQRIITTSREDIERRAKELDGSFPRFKIQETPEHQNVMDALREYHKRVGEIITGKPDEIPDYQI